MVSVSAMAQTPGASKLTNTSDVAPVEFTRLQFQNNVAEVTFELVSNSTVYSFDVENPIDIYRISATAHEPISIVLNANHIELNEKNQATSRTRLTYDHSRGLGDRTAVLPDTLFTPGRIFLGLASIDPVKVTLRVERIPPIATLDNLGNSKEKATRTGNDVAATSSGETTSCLKPARLTEGDVVDLNLLTAPKPKTKLYIYDHEGRSIAYNVAHLTSGLRLPGGAVCVVTPKSEKPIGWRLLTKTSDYSEVPWEPNRDLNDVTSGPKLSLGEPFVMPLDSPDIDTFNLAHLTEKTPVSLRVRSAVPVKMCLRQGERVNECLEGQRLQLSPFSITRETHISVENKFDKSAAYELTLESVDANPAETVFEPNRDVDYQPLIDGAFRKIGQLDADDDVDTIGFDTGNESQLWRIRVLGESVNSLYVRNARGNIAEVRRQHKGRSLTTPDFYLEPGPAYIRLSGVAGEYKVIAKPLGQPRQDSEREPNDDLPRRVIFGKPVTGVLSEGEKDRFSLFLPKEAELEISVDAPAGSKYNMGLWAASKQSSKDLERTTVEPGGWKRSIRVPAGEHMLELWPQAASPAEYSVSVDYANPFKIKDPGKIDMRVRDVPHIRAYSQFRQRLNVVLDITNTSNSDISGTIESWFARDGVEVSPSRVSVKSGETTTVAVNLILPDDVYDGELPFFTALVSPQENILGSVKGAVAATSDAQPLDRLPAIPVPTKLLGGINVAHAGLGAKWVATEGISIDEDGDYTRGNPAGADNLPTLIDGYISQGDKGFLSRNGNKPLPPVLDLPGEASIPIAGVGINTRLVEPWGLSRFAIDVSANGNSWQEVLNTTHNIWGKTAYYVFPKRPVEAKFVRLRAIVNGVENTAPIALNGLEVIAEPGHSGLQNLNVATVKLGALVTGQKRMQPRRYLQIDETEKDLIKLSGREGNPTEFNNAITFRNQLEAEIEAIELTYPSEIPEGGLDYEWAKTAILFASPKGSAGPFREIGRIDLPKTPQPGQVVRFDLPEWTPAKAVKVEYEHDEDYYFYPPQGVRIMERPESDSYKSVLGTWGERATTRALPGNYEALQPAENKSSLLSFLEDGGQTFLRNLSKDILNILAVIGTEQSGAVPKLLLPDQNFQEGLVEFNTRTETWRVEAKGDTNTIIIKTRGSEGFDPAVIARDPDRKIVEPIEKTSSDYSEVEKYTFPVDPGKFLDFEISESQRSTVFLFDQSPSVIGFIPKIRRAIVDFADNIVSGRDAIQFKAFGGDWADEDWFTDTEVLRSALANYVGSDRSDGEGALVDAAKLLMEREGSRAIVIITDGDVGTAEDLMMTLHQSRARVFVVKIPSSTDGFSNPAYSQPVTALWAGQTGGELAYVLQSEDISVAYARAAARLLGPKPYAIQAETDIRVLKPGFLTVRHSDENSEDEANFARALRQLIILDASGSMLKRLDEGRRIHIAKTALNTFLADQKARSDKGANIDLGLRLFGGEPQSCETNLIEPVSSFNFETLKSAIENVQPQNNAKTAIGAALIAAGKDLEDVKQPSSILLITDGEETCGGNPMEAIRALQEKGIDSRIDVVSFALDPEVDRRSFEAWAKAGGGVFVDAKTGEDLVKALRRSTQIHYSVFQGDRLVVSGVSGDEKIKLAAGSYDLRVDGQASQVFSIKPAETTEVTLTQN